MNQTKSDDVESRPKTNLRNTNMNDIHRAPQRSQTLIRRVAKKPASSRPINVSLPTKRRSMDVAKSSQITHFGRTNPIVEKQVPQTKTRTDIPAQTHPMTDRVDIKQQQKPKLVSVTSADIKNAAIASAMNKPSVKLPKISTLKRSPKAITIAIIIIVIAVIGAYFTYINMPNLSVKIASAQAGIDARYPDYHPDGYGIDGAVSFSEGEVTINFKANTGETKFTLKQVKSSWDSSAVLENIVKKNSNDRYITSQERGLTIYTYGGNAAWVNRGILYTIEGNAPLSNDQIRRMATSL